PTPRANPYPEVTDPFCRLPLSTLFYQLEAVNLGDLLRLSVRLGVALLRIFQDRRGRTRHCRGRCSSSHKTPSPDKPIPGS
ncbi:hypothetical protein METBISCDRAFT_20450, partial [Metschnikowia bicuspidata]